MLDAEKVASDIVETVSRELRLDRRFVVLDYVFGHVEGKPHINFLASSPFIEKGIRSFLGKHNEVHSLFTYSVEVLPLADVGKKKFALCNVSAAPVMKSSTHKSEQITQMLLGESADVLQQSNKDWLRLRLHQDNYVGWVSANQVCCFDEKEMATWQTQKKTSPRNLITPIMSSPKTNSEPIREFLFGTFLAVKKFTKPWISVKLPDGRVGWVKSPEMLPQRNKQLVSLTQLTATARMFLGISYQWGGRSVKGFDCSGFTQTVYRLNGIEIPRDASLQWLTGSDIGKEKKNFVEGDLLFFSATPERITHVAMWLGGAEFIHSSGFVKMNSFDRSHSLFDNNLLQRFVGARRILDAG